MSKTTDKVIALQQADAQTAQTKPDQRTTAKLKTVNIKGKPYVTVDERLIYFRQHYPNYALVSEVIDKTDNTILIKAIVLDANDRVVATGLAEEEKDSTYINKTSYVENCETSAWGRALANFGIGINAGSVASADEVNVAIAKQNGKKVLTPKQYKTALEKVKNKVVKIDDILKHYQLTDEQIKTFKLC